MFARNTLEPRTQKFKESRLLQLSRIARDGLQNWQLSSCDRATWPGFPMRTESNVSLSGGKGQGLSKQIWGIASRFGDPSKSANELDEGDLPFTCQEAKTPDLLFHQ